MSTNKISFVAIIFILFFLQKSFVPLREASAEITGKKYSLLPVIDPAIEVAAIPERPAVERPQEAPVTEETDNAEMPDIVQPDTSMPEPASEDLPSEEAEQEIYGGGPADIAFLPFDNYSKDIKARGKVVAALKAKLEEQGLRVLDEKAVSAFLCREQVRYNGYIPGEMARKLHDEFQVRSIITGSLISFSSGDDTHIGLVARVIDTATGVIAWADYAFVSGTDITSILGLGRVRNADKLVPKVIDRLLSSFRVAPAARGSGTAVRVAVIPFQNKTRFDGAGMVAMYMFMAELLKQASFEPIEFGDVRKKIIDLQVRSNGEIDHERLTELSKALNADTVLVGTVERYPSASDASASSNIAMTARLLDAGTNRILWYNTFQLSSEKNIIAFEWGEKEPADKVAYSVVSSMVKNMKTALSQQLGGKTVTVRKSGSLQSAYEQRE